MHCMAMVNRPEGVKAYVDYRGYLYCPEHGRPFVPQARVLPPTPIYARNTAHDGERCDYPGCAYTVPL